MRIGLARVFLQQIPGGINSATSASFLMIKCAVYHVLRKNFSLKSISYGTEFYSSGSLEPVQSRVSNPYAWCVKWVTTAAAVLPVLLVLGFAKPVMAVPSVNVGGFEFIPADSARDPDSTPNNGDEYMDASGTWNGAAEVSNTTGDTFRLTISNNAAGTPDVLVNDVAFDIALSLTVPSGFRLPSSPFTVTTSASGGDGGAGNCVAPGGGSITATQAGGAGTPVTFVFPANTNLPAQGAGTPCVYSFELGLTTNNVAAFATVGNNTLSYTFTYNEIDNDVGSQQSATGQQIVEVRAGDVIVTKVAVPNPADLNGAYADGETAEWTVSVFNNGTGGTFAALITDIPNVNFNPATLQLTPPASPPGTPFPVPQGNNQYTISYLDPGQTVDVTVQADVAIPVTASSCPDLRNDVFVQDRQGNNSLAFGSVVLDLEDPLLDYTPPNFSITFGTPTTVSFNVSNPGIGPDGGTARNIELAVSGLTGVTISNVSAEWNYNSGTSTFIYVGADGVPASGDEIIPNGGTSLLQFNAEMNTCGGPVGGFLTWTPSYENICGLNFTPPVRSSLFTVSNFPTLTLDKNVTPVATNFGEPAVYTIDLLGVNIGALPVTAGVDNDWTVTDSLPVGVGSGTIPTVPTGTIITIGATTYTDADVNVPVTAGDTIVWSGDRDDLIPTLPTVTINFTVDATSYCPPDPPVTFINTANLQYPSCGININDSAPLQVNDSPIDNLTVSPLQILNIGSAPFEAGRPDTDQLAANEPNEGERITFQASYPFPDPYGGQWDGSTFSAEMGTGTGGLTGAPLQLAFTDGNGNDVPDAGELTSVTVQVVNSNIPGPDIGPINLPIGPGDGEVTINAAGDFIINNLRFIETAIIGAGGDPIQSQSMENMTLTVTYSVTVPEGNLDGNLQPTDSVNIGVFDERVTLSVIGDASSCASPPDINFTSGVAVQAARADVFVGGSIANTNDAGACGVTTASIDIIAPAVGTFNADNFRLLLQSTDYDLPTNPGDLTLGGAGNLSALSPSITFPTPGDEVQLHVTPSDGDNITGTSTITFPITLNGAATGRDLQARIFFDSNHTSPDFSAVIDGDEDYPNPSFPVTFVGPTQTANLNVEFLPPSVVLGDPMNFADVDPGAPGLEGVFSWLVRITNVGTNTVSNYVFTNEVPPGYLPYRAGSNPVADAGLLTDPVMVWSGLPALPPGGSVELTVAIGLAQNAGCNVMSPNQTTVYQGCVAGTSLFNENGPTINFPVIDVQLDHQSSSFCELCRDGTVELQVRNEGASDVYDVVVTESLVGSGLQYVANSAEVFVEGSGGFVAVADHPSTTTTQIVWDSSNITDLGQLLSDLNGQPSEMTIRFQVRSIDANPENLVNATRQISATADFDLFCGDPGLPATVDNFTVPLRQPQPQVDKQGRNYSARQTAANYTDPVFGGTDDIVVWRVDVANSGAVSSADLEDLLINDTITPNSNFTLQFMCPTEVASDAQAASMEGGSPAVVAPCVAYATPYDVDDPFGNPGNDEAGAFIDAASGSSAFIFYLGTVADQCTNETNSADIAWGCEANSPPVGGINADGSSGNLNAGLAAGDDDDTALLSTNVNPSGVTIARTFTGINPAQPVGTQGTLTITVTNNSGGTIRDLALTNTLPVDYELDLTSLNPPNTPLVVTPAFGAYPGIIDGYSLNAADPNAPIFTLTSTTQGTINQRNLLRNGDQLVLTLGVIRINPFDSVNNPEVRTESVGSATDPDYSAAATTNTISLVFDDTCTVNPPLPGLPLLDAFNPTINPEDVDVDINPTDPNLLFILSDPTATLNLDVVVTNNGGHDATNYNTYVTIGNGMELFPTITSLPAGCTGPVAPPAEIGTPPSNASGIMPPEYNPADSLTYRCVLDDPLAPGATNTFAFTIQRALPLGLSGDLTFRADTLAASRLDDGSAPPDRGNAGYPYYSKDNVVARIIGFNLFKTVFGDCSEDNPPTTNTNVQIGEECTFEIEAEWFGFATPGFGNIVIRDARIYEGGPTNNPPPVEGSPATDPPNIPGALDGQGLVNIDTSNSTPAISVAAQNPAAPAALAETGLAWRLNPIVAVGNTEESFIARVRTRTLNDPVNTSAAPNLHAAARQDSANVRFDVLFTATGTTITFDETTVGYPPLALRSATLNVTEPNVTITKEICNESISIAANPANSGTSCQPFVALPTLVSGDSDDQFIYRLTVANEAAASGFARAPAYDITINDSFDASDQVAPFPFTSDGLDNDGDGLIDGADTDGEGTLDDATLVNADPADITFTATHNAAFSRLNAGSSILIHYRAQLDSMVTPTQQLTNTAGGSYDSLSGASGAQSAPLGNNSELGGAREYTIANTQATIEIDNITIAPGSKEFIDTSRRNAGLVAGSCASPCIDESVVIGEEVRVELEFTVPLSELRQFTLEDNLPAGIECIEAEDLVLPAFPGSDPGFSPGGSFPAAECNANIVRWDLSTAGDQILQGSGGITQFDVRARFIARVMNTAVNNNTDIIRNGGASTNAIVSYRDASNTLITIPIDEARLTVQEPQLTITKTMDPVAPNVTVDSLDTINVTIQIDNVGTSPAYNVSLLDTLDSNLEFIIGSVGGPNLPDTIQNIPSAPRFAYNNPLDPGNTLQFTFQVRPVDIVEPEEQLNNTIDVSFTSLPDNTVALNIAGQIGPDGAANGMRNGALPPAGDAVNDYEAQDTDFELVPALSLAKADLDPATTQLTIGERKNFEVTINLPEGRSDDVVVNDALNTGTGNFVIEHQAGFDVSYRCSNITTIRGTAVDCSNATTATATISAALGAANEPADEATGVVAWNFATIQTNTENDALVNTVNPQIVINYFARVANDASTVDGSTLQNLASVTFTSGEDDITPVTVNAPAIGPYTVIESNLIVNKTGPPTLGPGVPGAFTVTVDNQGNSNAWDITVEDQLPNLSPAAGGSCDANPLLNTPAPVVQIVNPGDPLQDRVLVVNQDYTINFQADPVCILTVVLTPEQGVDEDGRLQPGEFLQIDYTTTPDLDTPIGIGLTNVAGATQWFSLDTDGVTQPPEIRNYRNFPVLNDKQLTNGTVGINDHEDAHTFTTVLSLAITKTVAQATASPGDTLDYTITISNTTPAPLSNLNIVDDVDLLNNAIFPGGYFATGTLTNVLVNGVSAGANDFSNPVGGTVGTGLLDIRNQTVPASGNLVVTFSIDLRGPTTPLPKAFVENQASVNLGVGSVDSNVAQTEIINIGTDFIVEKTSADLSGDPNVLQAGDTLRYTITVKNIGATEPAIGITHAVDATLRDQVPANTTYVANSTRLNGNAVADVAAGVPPFASGLLINSPNTTTPGELIANPNLADNTNVAVISFDVRVNSGLINGTIISNQGLLTGAEQAFTPFTPLPFTPVLSDDPATTAIANDPTQDVIGSGPILDVQKTAALIIDDGDGIAEPGERLRYTLTIVNNGNAAASSVRLTDNVPTNTTYVANTTQLNATPVGQPDAGVAPLIAGIDINAPAAAAGVMPADSTATVIFDVDINAVADGTLISNQALLTASEVPDEPSDADGNDENGDQATVIVVGGTTAQLTITKEVVVVGGGTLLQGGQLDYLIRVRNIGQTAANNAVVSDVMPPEVAYVANSARLNGSNDPAQVSLTFAGNTLTADYGSSAIYGALNPGEEFVVSFRVTVGAAAGDNTVSNEAGLTWQGCAVLPARSDCAFDSANIDYGGAPGVANISGRVWDNYLHDDIYTANSERPLADWLVRLYINIPAPTSASTALATATTDSDGRYRFNGLAPVDPSVGGAYSLAFFPPQQPALYPAGSNISLGQTVTQLGTAGLMLTNAIAIPAGGNSSNENLPVEPTGVIYNSVTREPILNAQVELRRANGSQLEQACFSRPLHLPDNQQGQRTSVLGYYRFDIDFAAAGCSESGAAQNYQLRVFTLNDEGQLVNNISAVVPPEVGVLNVDTCPDSTDDRVPSPPINTCEVQEQGTAPDPLVNAGIATRYFLDLRLQQPTNAELFNNHIPVDVDTGALVSITKQTPLKNVVRGQLVPYVITVSNPQNFPLTSVEIRDYFPPGFKYVENSASIDGVQREPETDASTFSDPDFQTGILTWRNVVLQPRSTTTLKLLLLVGSGVGEAEYVNEAQVFITNLPFAISGRASATVRVVPDPTFDCSDIIGKVYDDKNRNGYPDAGEPGIAGARVATAQGLLSTTDEYGRFHIACAVVPNPDRGSNFILKVDERTLPSGYRITTENPRVQRLTRGKVAKFNFGATIHRIVRLDLADQAFVSGGTQIEEHWAHVLEELYEQLQEAPSILRITYLGDTESEKLAKRRVRAIKALIEKRWEDMSCCYNLNVETELFWRRGQPLQ